MVFRGSERDLMVFRGFFRASKEISMCLAESEGVKGVPGVIFGVQEGGSNHLKGT